MPGAVNQNKSPRRRREGEARSTGCGRGKRRAGKKRSAIHLATPIWQTTMDIVAMRCSQSASVSVMAEVYQSRCKNRSHQPLLVGNTERRSAAFTMPDVG